MAETPGKGTAKARQCGSNDEHSRFCRPRTAVRRTGLVISSTKLVISSTTLVISSTLGSESTSYPQNGGRHLVHVADVGVATPTQSRHFAHTGSSFNPQRLVTTPTQGRHLVHVIACKLLV